MSPQETTSNTLAGALGSEMGKSELWYTNYPETITPAHDTQDVASSNAQEPNVAPASPPQRYTLLKQTRYTGQGTCIIKSPISFSDEKGNPIPLHVMLDKTFEGLNWQDPWTSDSDVGQKMHIRVRIANEADENVLDCEADHLINVRGFQKEPKAITKSKLGHRIAKTLKESEHFTKFLSSKGHAFEDVALLDLAHVSQGSWQPTLYIEASSSTSSEHIASYKSLPRTEDASIFVA